MKALSVRQPYTTSIACGEKTVEWRSWTTRHRGDLLICSSLAWADGDYEINDEHLYLFPMGVRRVEDAYFES